MIAMTAITGWRRPVLALIESFRMHAGFVFAELVARDFIGFHVVGVSMAFGAGICNIGRKDCRLRIFNRLDAMIAVATYTGCYIVITGFEELPVNACVIFFLLIDAQTWIEALYELRVAVASTAESRYIFRVRPGNETFLRIHCPHRIILGRITAMTINAG
jgi:hypothetical protein